MKDHTVTLRYDTQDEHGRAARVALTVYATLMSHSQVLSDRLTAERLEAELKKYRTDEG